MSRRCQKEIGAINTDFATGKNCNLQNVLKKVLNWFPIRKERIKDIRCL